MANDDVVANLSKSDAEGISCIVWTQSDLLDALATHLAMPVAVADAAAKVLAALCPVIAVKGQRMHALAHYAVPCLETFFEAARRLCRDAGQFLGFGDGCGVVRCWVRRQPSVVEPDSSVSRSELRSDHQKRRHRQQKDPQPRVKPSLGQAPGEAVSDPKGEKRHQHTCEQQGQTKGHGCHNRQ